MRWGARKEEPLKSLQAQARPRHPLWPKSGIQTVAVLGPDQEAGLKPGTFNSALLGPSSLALLGQRCQNAGTCAQSTRGQESPTAPSTGRRSREWRSLNVALILPRNGQPASHLLCQMKGPPASGLLRSRAGTQEGSRIRELGQGGPDQEVMWVMPGGRSCWEGPTAELGVTSQMG